MSAAPASFLFEGQEFALWTEKQLEGVNREALKQRALNLRDHVGQHRLPPMPRQPEGLSSWILSVQSALQGESLDPPMGEASPPSCGDGPAGVRSGPPASGTQQLATPTDVDALQAFADSYWPQKPQRWLRGLQRQQPLAWSWSIRGHRRFNVPRRGNLSLRRCPSRAGAGNGGAQTSARPQPPRMRTRRCLQPPTPASQ